MRAVDVIREKRSGREHRPETIEAFLKAYLANEVADYQMSAWLMAVCFQGMTAEETATLTKAMMRSGHTYEFAPTPRPVDKHSTGGVGDKISIALAPLAAACGLRVPMVSGRGLGHTGGTLDKLESIPGFRVQLEPKELMDQMDRLGFAMIGQSEDFVPADRRLYALRDVTATVESVPLICASILSKKAASGARGLVMDVKVGTGAFMETMDEARELSRALISTGVALGLSVTCLLTNMSRPLGVMVGNSLEVIEAVDILRGQGPTDVTDLTIELCAEMILLARYDQTVSLDNARAEARRTLTRGRALEKFEQLVVAQGGDIRAVLENRLDFAPDRKDWCADRAGVVGPMNMRGVGDAACLLGAGRLKTTDLVDHGVGLEMLVRPGDQVEAGQPLVRIHHRNGRGLEEALNRLSQSIIVTDEPVDPGVLILERMTA
jgi:pyrimidine-nucleoside phosphorylase/thymidine phosphorylase